MVKRLPREVTDHNPLILSSGSCGPLKHIQFRFELSWLENPDFFTAVKKLWSKPCRAKSALDKIQQKLKILKQYFKGCGFNLQGELRKKRELISEELAVLESTEESDGLDSEQTLRKVELTKESLQLLDQEESYWHNRCHEQWLLKGDNNISIFIKLLMG